MATVNILFCIRNLKFVLKIFDYDFVCFKVCGVLVLFEPREGSIVMLYFFNF